MLYCVCLFIFIVPSDSPQTFESVADQFLVNFTWTPPTTPNGIITSYNLMVSKQSGTTTTNNYDTTSYTYEATTLSVSLGDFLPFQEYNATITASTVVGYGPVATAEGRTEQGKLYKCPQVFNQYCMFVTLDCIIVHSKMCMQSYIYSLFF